MALLSLLQSSLVGGELSPTMAARADLARYQNSVKLCRNFIVRHWGGADNRPGTSYVSTIKNVGSGVRMIPFIFNNSQSYVLVFGQNYIRFVANGAMVQQVLANCPNYSSTVTYQPGNWVNVSGVLYYCIKAGINQAPASSPTYWTQQTVYEIWTPYGVTDVGALKFTQSADVMTLFHQKYAPQQLSRLADNNWTIAAFANINGPFQAANTDQTATVYCSATTGNITITANSPIFKASHVGSLFRIDEQNLSGVLPWEANKQIATGATSPNGLLRRSNGNVYKCVTTGSPGTGNEWRTGTLAPTWTSGTEMDGDGNAITAGGTTYATKAGMSWQYLHSQFGVAKITGFTDSTHVSATVVSAEDGVAGYMPDSVVITSSQTTTSEYNAAPPLNQTVFPLTPATGDSNPANYICTKYYDNGTSTHHLGSKTVDAAGANMTFAIAPHDDPSDGVNLLNISYINTVSGQNQSWIWYFGSWSADSGYPACGTYMGDRLCAAGTPTEPQTFWMSKTGQYIDFGEGNPIVDSDSISETVNSRKINTISDMVPLTNLMVLTTGSLIAVFGDQDGLLAPSKISSRHQTARGINALRALSIGDGVVWFTARGYQLRDAQYSFQQNAYVGDDLTQFVSHLFIGHSFVDYDYSEDPYSVIWAVRDDGELLSGTYRKTEQILAWARHDTTNGTFENVCVVPEGNEDVPYFVVKRTVNGAATRHIERLNTRVFTDLKNSVFLDDSLSFDGTNTTATNLMKLTGGTKWDATENLTLTASGAGNTPFTAAMVGAEIVFTDAAGGKIKVKILGYTSSTVVTVRPIETIPADLQGIATTNYAIAYLTFSGMTHLIGQSVGILADGGTQAPVTVANDGTITLASPAVVVHAGLPITAQIQTLEPSYPYGETISAKSLRSIYKNVPEAKLIVDNTRPFKAGTSFTNMYETKIRWAENMGDETAPFTGTINIDVDSPNDLSATVCIQVDDPVPVSILGIVPEMAAGQ